MSTSAVSTKTSWPQLAGRTIDPLVVIAAAAILGPAPLAIMHLRALWQKEQYQFFPFVIGAVIWFLVSRWRQAPRVDIVPRWPAIPWVILSCSVVLLIGAVLTVSGWLAFVAMNVALAAVFWWLGNRRRIEYLWGIWCLLWLMVPPPLRVDERVVAWLQRLSSMLSSAVLDLLGVLHVMSGNVLTLQSKELFVDEACSGIISVMSIIACSMIYAIYRNRSVVHLVLLTLMGVCWAVVMNTARISVIAVVYHWWGINWTEGTPHELLSLVVFLGTFGALVSSDVLLEGMLAPISVQNVGEAASGKRLVTLWNWVFSRRPAELAAEEEELPSEAHAGDVRTRGAVAVAVVFAGLAGIQLFWLPSTNTAEAKAATERALAIDENLLPPRIGPWVREGFEEAEREMYSEFGRYSRTFRYRHAEHPLLQATLSLDFPYMGGWHDLCMCYRGQGWATEERAVESGDRLDADWQFVEAGLEQPTGETAVVLFTGFDVSGAEVEPPTAAVLFRPWFRLRRRLLLQLAPQLFQVQVFAAGQEAADDAVQEDLRTLLFEGRKRFRERVAGSGERGAESKVESQEPELGER